MNKISVKHNVLDSSKQLATLDSSLAQLPHPFQHWLEGNKHGIRGRKVGHKKTQQSVTKILKTHALKWPKRDIVFISDLHADADALLASLLASGGIILTGKGDEDFELTAEGKKLRFIFGGDFFDKGPSNLRLLRVLKAFINTGARVRLLAGNHDIRILFGMRCAGQTDDPRNGHFFVRMGAKAIPFLIEIRDEYLTHKHALKHIPDEQECAKQLFPQEIWWQQFPELATWVMPPQAVARETKKIEQKMGHFEKQCQAAGLTLREAYAAALKWKSLFLNEGGEFHWFFNTMQLAHRKGSFLFVHAGLDDRIAVMLKDFGYAHLNRLFRQQLVGNPFEFYYGPIANTIRTKYRTVDMPLTLYGASIAHQAGIHAVIHGHRNLHHGQRIAARKTLLNFECDITLDRHSRRREGLSGIGAGATLIRSSGHIVGISNDYKWAKVFDPAYILARSV